MTRRKAISVLIALALIVLTIPTSKAIVDEWVTGLCDEDLFIASYLFDDVDMVYLQGDEAQIRGWYWFEAPILMYGRYIKEAYLEVRTPSIGATDPNASMTIYGKPSGKGGTPSYYEDPSAINGPYTTNTYTVNLSSFVGPGVLHNITVTNILREINQGYYFWNGHDIAFVTLSTSDHSEERTINSEESGHPAKLYIHYSTPPTPPGVPGDAEYIDSYRNHTIWEVDNLGDNRTGASADVNWNLLNVTQLTEQDSGSSLTRNNATWITASTYAAQETGNFYNDSGSANINTFFLRAAIDITSVTCAGVAYEAIPGVGGLSTSSPTGSAGLPYGTTGDWAGLICNVHQDDLQYRFHLRERSVMSDVNGGYSQWFTENTGTLYIEFRLNTTGGANWVSYDIYDDQEFTNSINYDEMVLDYATDPFRYAMITNSMGTMTSSTNFQFYTYLDMPVANDSTWYIVDYNGTIVDIIEDFDGDLTDIEDIIDTDIIGYPDPEDPDPPGWEDTGFTSLQMKLVFLVMGLVLFLGAPLYGFAERPEAATWILIMFSMICGVALLLSLQTM